MRIPKPAKRSAEERRAARRKKARARRRAAPPGVKWLERLADDLHSIRVRAIRGGCELALYPAHRAESCLGAGAHPSSLQLAHGFTRRDKATRWDLSNCFAACAGCHRKHTPSGAAWYAWMQERLGPQVYAAVQERAQWLAKPDRDSLIYVCVSCLQDISAMPHSIRREWAEERLASPSIAPRLRRAGLAY